MSDLNIEIIPGVELKKGKRVFACGSCGRIGNREHLKRGVRSVIHEHPAASKVQKKVKVLTTFKDTETGAGLAICLPCQIDAINGIAHGDNFV